MKTTEQGLAAEAAVAKCLERQKFSIIARNWRTPVCEIDLVATKDKIAYFIEVKYRASPAQGDGFEYITSKKLNQMRFAAEIWVQHNDWPGDWRLLAAAASGLRAETIDIVEI